MFQRSKIKIVPGLFAGLVIWFAGDVAAHQKTAHDHRDLATKATNPVGALIPDARMAHQPSGKLEYRLKLERTTVRFV